MSNVTGNISNIWENDRQTRYGMKKTYTIEVNGNKYGCGFDKLPDGAVIGATVSFTTTQNGQYVNADAKTMQVVNAPAANAAGQTKGNSDDPRQRVIVYQAARNAAIDLFGKMLTCEAVKLPAKQADKYDAVMALVNEHTDRFYLDAMAVYTGDMVIEDPMYAANVTEMRDD